MWKDDLAQKGSLVVQKTKLTLIFFFFSFFPGLWFISKPRMSTARQFLALHKTKCPVFPLLFDQTTKRAKRLSILYKPFSSGFKEISLTSATKWIVLCQARAAKRGLTAPFPPLLGAGGVNTSRPPQSPQGFPLQETITCSHTR